MPNKRSVHIYFYELKSKKQFTLKLYTQLLGHACIRTPERYCIDPTTKPWGVQFLW